MRERRLASRQVGVSAQQRSKFAGSFRPESAWQGSPFEARFHDEK